MLRPISGEGGVQRSRFYCEMTPANAATHIARADVAEEAVADMTVLDNTNVVITLRGYDLIGELPAAVTTDSLLTLDHAGAIVQASWQPGT